MEYILLVVEGLASILTMYCLLSNNLPKTIIKSRAKSVKILSAIAIIFTILECLFHFPGIDLENLELFIYGSVVFLTFPTFILIASLFGKSFKDKKNVTEIHLKEEDYEIVSDTTLDVALNMSYESLIRIKEENRIIISRQVLPLNKKKAITIGYTPIDGQESIYNAEYIITDTLGFKNLFYRICDLYCILLGTYGFIYSLNTKVSTNPAVYNKTLGLLIVPLVTLAMAFSYRQTAHGRIFFMKIIHLLFGIIYYACLLGTITIWFK